MWLLLLLQQKQLKRLCLAHTLQLLRHARFGSLVLLLLLLVLSLHPLLLLLLQFLLTAAAA